MNQSIKNILNMIIAAAIIGAASNLFLLNVKIAHIEEQLSSIVNHQTKNTIAQNER